jgi:large subunit ribosomal protein L18
MRIQKKIELAGRRHWRVRSKVSGTAARPRMSVCFTNQHIHVQFIDDILGATLASACTTGDILPGGHKGGANVATATIVGGIAANAAKSKGITTVVFDRGSSRYHGKVKALADAARDAGLLF